MLASGTPHTTSSTPSTATARHRRGGRPSYVSAASPTMGAGASTQRWTKDEVLAVIGVACDDAAFEEAASGGTIDTETLSRYAADPKAVLWRNLQRFKEQHNELAPYGGDLRDIEGVALDKSKRQREANGSEVDFESLYVVAQQARDTFVELVDQALRFSEYAEAPAPAPAASAEAPAEPLFVMEPLKPLVAAPRRPNRLCRRCGARPRRRTRIDNSRHRLSSWRSTRSCVRAWISCASRTTSTNPV